MSSTHLATFNVFREPGGLYVTVADATGVRAEVGHSIVPLHIFAMRALREALKQMDARAAQGIEAGTAATTKIGAVHESPVGNADAPITDVGLEGRGE